MIWHEEVGWHFELLAYQRECCWTCGASFRHTPTRTDHDHATGLVRGLLCNRCNVGEGSNLGGIDWDAYRADPPAKRLGLEIQTGRIDPFEALRRDAATDRRARDRDAAATIEDLTNR